MLNSRPKPDLSRIDSQDRQHVQREVEHRPDSDRVEREDKALGHEHREHHEEPMGEEAWRQLLPRRHRKRLPVRLRILEEALRRRKREKVTQPHAEQRPRRLVWRTPDPVWVPLGVQIEVMIQVSEPVAGPRVPETVRADISNDPVQARAPKQAPMITGVHKLGEAIEGAEAQGEADHKHQWARHRRVCEWNGRERAGRKQQVGRDPPRPDPAQLPQLVERKVGLGQCIAISRRDLGPEC